MDTLFAIGAGAYGATTVTYLASLWTERPSVGRLAVWLLRATLVFWSALLVWWAVDTGLSGGTRLGLGLSAWSLCALYLLLLRRYPIAALGSFVTALSTVLAVLAVLGLFVARPHPVLTGALADWLLWIHISLAFVGIVAFAFATAVSLVYLLQARMLKTKSRSELRRRLPPLDVLDRLSLRSIIVGFPFYTVALLLGSVQAVRAGEGTLRLSYVLAVVSWVIYGVVLQARLAAGWRGPRAAILTTVGLAVAMAVVARYSLGLG